MKRTKPNRIIAYFLALTLALQSLLPSVALAEQRTVEVDNHTEANAEAKVVTNIVIDGVDKPTTGAKLDQTAGVSTASGDTWEIAVVWMRDDLQKDTDTADEGHTYLPALAFVVPEGYALESNTATVTLSDSLTALFDTQEIISVYEASTGITYIIPASLKDLFAQASSANAAHEGNADVAQAQQEQQADAQEANADDTPAQQDQQTDDEEAPGLGGDGTVVEVHCAQTARDVLTDEDLMWLIDFISNYLEPQAVELLLDSYPSIRKAADNGEIGKEISLYIYYQHGDKDGKPEHEDSPEALAYVSGGATSVNGEPKFCYMMAVNVESLLQKDADGKPIRNEETGKYTFVRDGDAIDTLCNTLVHELFHALMYDYNRTGMAGGTDLQDILTDSHNNFIKPGASARFGLLQYPQWFIEGTATTTENNYQFRYDIFQMLRNVVNADGTTTLNPSFTQQLILDNYLGAKYSDGTDVYFGLDCSVGGQDDKGRTIDTGASRYVSGYLATLYLSELATRYNYYGESSVRTVDGVTTVDANMLRGGLDSLLRWMHEDNATLDSLINALSPKDENGQPIFTDTKSFEEQFVFGPKLEDGRYGGCPESLPFVESFLNYMLTLDNQLPEDEHPNGSILFDFGERFVSPLDPNKNSSSEYLQITDSNSLVPSTVRSDVANIGGGKSDPDQTSSSKQHDEQALPAAAKVEDGQTKKTDDRAKDKDGQTKDEETQASTSETTQATATTQEVDATFEDPATSTENAAETEPTAGLADTPVTEPAPTSSDETTTDTTE